MSKNAYVGVKPQILEYIESTGTQYISTGWLAGVGDKIEFECSTTKEFCVGSRKAVNDDAFFLWVRNNQGDIAVGLGDYTNVYEYDYTNSNQKHKYTFDSTGKVYIDDELITSNAGTLEVSTSYNIYLGLFNNGGTAVSGDTYGGKLYSCKVYSKQGLVRHMIPAKDSNGVCCLYDKLMKKFYYNKGTGDFIEGPVVGSISELQSVARKVKRMYVGVKKTTADNILKNGSLAKNTDGWTISSYNTVTQKDGYTNIKITRAGTGTYPNYQMFETISGNTSETRQVIYACAKVRGKSTNVSYPRVYLSRYSNGSSSVNYSDFASIDGKSGTALNDGDWHIVSTQVQTYNTSSGAYFDYFRVAFGISSATINDEMDIKEVYLVNLTETFGKGKEPTKEWCDANLTTYADKIAITNGQSVARKIKNGYVGVSGKAREFYTEPGQLINYTMLYNAGDECEEVTGGWVAGNSASWGGITKNATNMVGNLQTSGGGKGGVATNNKISLANYNGALLVIAGTSTGTSVTVGLICSTSIHSSYGRVYGSAIIYKEVQSGKNIEKNAYTVEFSKTEEAYINAYVESSSYSGTHSVTLYNMCLLKQDDWQYLCTVAGLNPTNYADETALCADSTAISTILSNRNAVECMLRECTGTFMGEFVTSNICLTALNNSPYTTIIHANEHWNKFLNMVA